MHFFLGIYGIRRYQHYAEFLLDAFRNAPLYVSNPTYLNYIKGAEDYYTEKLCQAFPKEVLEGTFLKEYGSETLLTFKEVLKKYEGEPVYIDFWASWCGPCRHEIAESGIAKKYLQEKGIRCLYFSIRDEDKNWQRAVEEDKIQEDQYLIQSDNGNSLLSNFLSIKGIPFYTLLDKNHLIFSRRAPHPISIHFEELKALIERMEL